MLPKTFLLHVTWPDIHEIRFRNNDTERETQHKLALEQQQAFQLHRQNDEPFRGCSILAQACKRQDPLREHLHPHKAHSFSHVPILRLGEELEFKIILVFLLALSPAHPEESSRIYTALSAQKPPLFPAYYMADRIQSAQENNHEQDPSPLQAAINMGYDSLHMLEEELQGLYPLKISFTRVPNHPDGKPDYQNYQRAGVAKQADAPNSRSGSPQGSVGSTPTARTNANSNIGTLGTQNHEIPHLRRL